MIGHGLFDRVHVADRPAYLTALADAAAQGEDRSVEFRIRRDGGTRGRRPIRLGRDALPSARPGGEWRRRSAREVVAVLRDVSERKTQERALEIARKESERANAAKSRFLATMSHELRTPLNAIIGFSDMLGNETLALDDARKPEYARLINESGRHLLSVVNGILDMSKMETGNFEITPEPFAPAPGDRELLRHAGAQGAGGRRRAQTCASRRACRKLVADRRAFNQILINLVSNAIKFTPRGGRVTVGARSDGGKLAVTVEDTGVGIGEDDLPRLGEAFFQARASYDRRHDGSGLGLSIVKGLVRLHGGDMDIRSRLGEGTRVTVRLPLDGEGRAAGRSDQAGDRARRRTRRNCQTSRSRKVRKSAKRAQAATVERGRLGAAIMQHPREFVGMLVATAADAAIFVNALFLQHGPHPAPIFATRPLVSAPAQGRKRIRAGREPGAAHRAISSARSPRRASTRARSMESGAPGTDAAVRDFAQAAGLTIAPEANTSLLHAIKASKRAGGGACRRRATDPIARCWRRRKRCWRSSTRLPISATARSSRPASMMPIRARRSRNSSAIASCR